MNTSAKEIKRRFVTQTPIVFGISYNVLITYILLFSFVYLAALLTFGFKLSVAIIDSEYKVKHNYAPKEYHDFLRHLDKLKDTNHLEYQKKVTMINKFIAHLPVGEVNLPEKIRILFIINEQFANINFYSYNPVILIVFLVSCVLLFFVTYYRRPITDMDGDEWENAKKSGEINNKFVRFLNVFHINRVIISTKKDAAFLRGISISSKTFILIVENNIKEALFVFLHEKAHQYMVDGVFIKAQHILLMILYTFFSLGFAFTFINNFILSLLSLLPTLYIFKFISSRVLYTVRKPIEHFADQYAYFWNTKPYFNEADQNAYSWNTKLFFNKNEKAMHPSVIQRKTFLRTNKAKSFFPALVLLIIFCAIMQELALYLLDKTVATFLITHYIIMPFIFLVTYSSLKYSSNAIVKIVALTVLLGAIIYLKILLFQAVVGSVADFFTYKDYMTAVKRLLHNLIPFATPILLGIMVYLLQIFRMRRNDALT